MTSNSYFTDAVNAADELELKIQFLSASRFSGRDNRRGLPKAKAHTTQGAVLFPYAITDEDTYLAALHEVGHCTDPNLATVELWHAANKVDAEAFAWMWVLQNTLHPITLEGFRTIYRCFCTYLRKNRLDHHPFLDELQSWADQAPVIPFPELQVACRVGSVA